MADIEPVAWQWRHPRATGGEWCHAPDGPRPDSITDTEYRGLYPASAITALQEENKKLRGHLDALAMNDAGYASIKTYEARAEAAEARVAELEARLAEAKKALEPFAATARYYDPGVRSHGGDDDQGIASYASWEVNDGADHSLTVGDLRAARAFLKSMETGE